MQNSSSDYYSVIIAKVAALLAIGIVSFICGFLPYYLIRACRTRFPTSTIHKITSGVICFSGGTLLGVTFLHLMPEVREKIARIQATRSAFKFPESLPLSDIIAMSGFFGVYVLDELMHLCVEWYSLRMRRKPSSSPDQKTARRKNRQLKGNSKVCSQLPHEVSVFSLDKHENSKHHVSISRRSNHHANPVTSCVCHTAKLNPGDVTEEKELVSMTPSQMTMCCDRVSPSVIPPVRDYNRDSHACDRVPVMPHVSGLITIVALSFHDVFEGMAVGVEKDLNSILFLYLSIASHKYAIAFCIGMDLVLAGSRLKMIVLSMMTFSIVSPIGVIVGMIVVADRDEKYYEIDSPASVVLQGVAGGTLIYVVCFEVLQREGTDTHAKGIQNVMFVILGFLVTLTFKVLVGHSHVHEKH